MIDMDAREAEEEPDNSMDETAAKPIEDRMISPDAATASVERRSGGENRIAMVSTHGYVAADPPLGCAV